MSMIWSKDVCVTVNDRAQLLTDISERFETHRGFSVATINLDHVVKLARNSAFRDAYAAHTHVTADGNPIVWLSHLAGQGDVRLVPGSELIEPVAAIAARQNLPVALVGATATSLAAASAALCQRHEGLNIVRRIAPQMGFDPDGAEADAIIADLQRSGARLVFLALGAPKQERFAARAQTRLPATGFLSIGAGLDFVSGAQNRAPAWVRKLALEWMWRLLSNPKRLAHRYGLCLLALPGLTARALATRLKST